MSKTEKKSDSLNFIRQRVDTLNKIFNSLSDNLQENMNDLLRQANVYKGLSSSGISKIFDKSIKSITSNMEKAIQKNLNKALTVMNIPTVNDIKRLEKKIDGLTKKVAKLNR